MKRTGSQNVFVNQTDVMIMNLAANISYSRKELKVRQRRSQEVWNETSGSNDRTAAWKYIRTVTFTVNKGLSTEIESSSLNDYFASIVTSQDDAALPADVDEGIRDGFCLSDVTVGRVAKLLSSVKSSTAPGPDGLSAYLIRQTAAQIAPNIVKIMNCSISQSCFPQGWKVANIKAVYKQKGAKSEASNYRPISLLPILARIFEKLIAEQLSSHCEQNKVIPEQQFGFRKGSGCEHALISAVDSWREHIDGGEVVGALLIDLSKAFDTVSHKLLLDSLRDIGCSTDAMKWFSSYLTDRTQRVVSQMECTAWKTITRGVPQGSGLSPLLFNIFVRDLPTASQANTVQFADDVTHSAADKDIDVVKTKLEQSFKLTKDYCTSKGLTVNAAKTQFIVMKSAAKKLPPDVSIVVDGIVIQTVQAVKLLGVTIDMHLTFAEHIRNTVTKCHGLLGLLRRAAPLMSSELMKLAYIALIRSHLEYASALFASVAKTHLVKLDVIQKMASRIISYAPRNAHSAPLLEALGLESLHERRMEHVINIVRKSLEKKCHPSFVSLFLEGDDGKILTEYHPRTAVGRKRFCNTAVEIYNSSVQMQI